MELHNSNNSSKRLYIQIARIHWVLLHTKVLVQFHLITNRLRMLCHHRRHFWVMISKMMGIIRTRASVWLLRTVAAHRMRRWVPRWPTRPGIAVTTLIHTSTSIAIPLLWICLNRSTLAHVMTRVHWICPRKAIHLIHPFVTTKCYNSTWAEQFIESLPERIRSHHQIEQMWEHRIKHLRCHLQEDRPPMPILRFCITYNRNVSSFEFQWKMLPHRLTLINEAHSQTGDDAILALVPIVASCPFLNCPTKNNNTCYSKLSTT